MSHESESEKRAPADLALVQRFINTVELDEGPEDDELTDPAALAGYARHAAAVGVPDADERLADLVLAVARGEKRNETGVEQ